MDTIIVTVMNKTGSFRCDLEMPTNQPLAVLKPDIARAIDAYDSSLGLGNHEIRLVNVRTGREIPDYATLEMAGVWNGDYIVLEPSWSF